MTEERELGWCDDAISGVTSPERAAADHEWTYGHVVIDEAQELSKMDWSMIHVALSRHRWTHRQLTINYRTPAEIMDVAARVLAEINPALTRRRPSLRTVPRNSTSP